MGQRENINLLIRHDSREDAERLINVLKNANYEPNVTYIDEQSALNNTGNPEHWDLAIVYLQGQVLTARDFYTQLRQCDPHLPSLAISDSDNPPDIVDAMRLGASYVIPRDEEQYFTLAATSAINTRKQRRALSHWREKYRASEQRCEALMEDSRRPLAVIQDGTYTFANLSYAQILGFAETEDMLLLPAIDTIDTPCHQLFAPYLQPLDAGVAIPDNRVTLTLQRQDEKKLDATLKISQIEFQGEPALQLTVEDHPMEMPETPFATSATADVTEDQNQPALEPALESPPETETIPIDPGSAQHLLSQHCQALANSGDVATVLCLCVDQYRELLAAKSATNAERLIAACFEYIAGELNCSDLLRLDANTFLAILPKHTLDRGIHAAKNLYTAVRAHNFDMGDHSMIASVSISLRAINSESGISDSFVDELMDALNEGMAHGQHGPNDLRIYPFEENQQAEYDLDNEEQLTNFGRELIERRLIGIAFQPIVGLNNNQSEYYEVLMRPKTDEHSELVPKDFVAQVFQTKVAGEIDRWVILEALKKLGEKHTTHPNTCFFIKLTAASLTDKQTFPWLKLALKTARISTSAIVIQLRELEVVHHIDSAMNLISQLKSAGIKIALTQFGASENPLLVLEKIEADFLIIDSEKIKDAEQDADKLEKLQKFLQILRDSGRDQIIAPRIESPTLIPPLWQSGVSFIQGHYIQAPSSSMNYEFGEEE